jgi:hypothetical protein
MPEGIRVGQVMSDQMRWHINDQTVEDVMREMGSAQM